MNMISFQDITQQCQAKVSESLEYIKDIYSKFSFLTFDPNIMNQNENQIKSILIDFLEHFKFIIYSIIPKSRFQNKMKKKNIQSKHLYKYFYIICCENYCIYIKNNDIKLIDEVIQSFKDISIINILENDNNKPKCRQDLQATYEAESFYDHFKDKIGKNYFILKTLKTIAGYLIRRNFYPNHFFNDCSFFHFDNIINFYETRHKERLNKLFNMNNEYNYLLSMTYFFFDNFGSNKQLLINEEDIQYPIYEFKKYDFIVLRNIYSNEHVSVDLVIHIKSLHLFAIRYASNLTSCEKQHEIDFGEFYSHKCLTRFYGYLKENKEIVGFVYEFMSNGSLSDYIIKGNGQKINEITSFIFMNRIFRGINYLHSKSLIHRDLKPGNILIDHNGLCYISDFETVRIINDQDDVIDDEIFTSNIGSDLYASQEQHQNHFTTFSTDIYSFGMLIYFLFEHKDMWSSMNNCLGVIDNLEKGKFKKLTKGSKIIQEIYVSCIKFDPKKRITNKEIIEKICEEFNSLTDYDFLKNMKITEVIEYLFQNYWFLSYKEDNQKEIYKYTKHVIDLSIIFLKHKSINRLSTDDEISQFLFIVGNDIFSFGNKLTPDYSTGIKFIEISAKLNNMQALSFLGNIYYYGYKVKKDYLKAKQYYEIAAYQGNVEAFYNLIDIYFNNYDLIINYKDVKNYLELIGEKSIPKAFVALGIFYFQHNDFKANYYFELAALQNDPDAFFCLGVQYLKGKGVEKNYLKAIEYLEKAAKQNHSESMTNLGILYSDGKIIKRDYLKARKYLESAAKFNHSQALLLLGIFYEFGYGVVRDYKRAKYYYEQSAQQGNTNALVNLGNLYFSYNNNNENVQNFLKAKENYELAAKQKNSVALFNLGVMYENGNGVKKDYLKMKQYYESSALLGNPLALYKLGYLYENGIVVPQNFIQAIKLYKSSAEKNNIDALYALGSIYYNGEYIDSDIEKSIEYYKRCIYAYENSRSINETIYFMKKYLIKYYLSCNDLGLIYLTIKQDENDIKIIEKYFRDSSLSNFAFSLNNFGLFCQFYLKDIAKAKYYYEKASENLFALADFNLGYLYEIQGLIVQSIEHYNKAIQNENQLLTLKLEVIYDKRLEISKKIIICLAYLKVIRYYLTITHSEENIQQAKNLLNALIIEEKFEKAYISLLVQMKIDDIFNLFNDIIDFIFDCQPFENSKDFFENCDEYETFCICYEYIIHNHVYLNNLVRKIDSLIEIICDVLYSPPYLIILGRIPINKNKSSFHKDITKDFYNGFYCILNK